MSVSGASLASGRMSIDGNEDFVSARVFNESQTLRRSRRRSSNTSTSVTSRPSKKQRQESPSREITDEIYPPMNKIKNFNFRIGSTKKKQNDDMNPRAKKKKCVRTPNSTQKRRRKSLSAQRVQKRLKKSNNLDIFLLLREEASRLYSQRKYTQASKKYALCLEQISKTSCSLNEKRVLFIQIQINQAALYLTLSKPFKAKEYLIEAHLTVRKIDMPRRSLVGKISFDIDVEKIFRKLDERMEKVRHHERSLEIAVNLLKQEKCEDAKKVLTGVVYRDCCQFRLVDLVSKLMHRAIVDSISELEVSVESQVSQLRTELSSAKLEEMGKILLHRSLVAEALLFLNPGELKTTVINMKDMLRLGSAESDHRRAIELFEKGIEEALRLHELNEHYIGRMYFRIAGRYRSLRFFDHAADACEKSIGYIARYSKTWIRYVNILLEQNKFYKARSVLEHMLKEKIGDTVKIEAELQRVRRLHPHHSHYTRSSGKKPKTRPRKTHYTALGVGSQASTKEIRKAFKRLALKCHPDKCSGLEEEFKRINEAYNILVCPMKRREYDESLN
eukprot:augustus_masked-scaffold_8-processed-gene-3.3-mRNA-1 protein AED:0.43 eAED:0.43 QI:0/-1/0/1/-1/1/1/0/559